MSDSPTPKRAASKSPPSTAQCHRKRAGSGKLIPTHGPHFIIPTANRPGSRNSLTISPSAMPGKELLNKLDLFRSNSEHWLGQRKPVGGALRRAFAFL